MTKTVKQIRKKDKKVTDPPRFPKVINGYEGKMKKNYTNTLHSMTLDMGKEMVNILKK